MRVFCEQRVKMLNLSSWNFATNLSATQPGLNSSVLVGKTCGIHRARLHNSARARSFIHRLWSDDVRRCPAMRKETHCMSSRTGSSGKGELAVGLPINMSAKVGEWRKTFPTFTPGWTDLQAQWATKELSYFEDEWPQMNSFRVGRERKRAKAKRKRDYRRSWPTVAKLEKGALEAFFASSSSIRLQQRSNFKVSTHQTDPRAWRRDGEKKIPRSSSRLASCISLHSWPKQSRKFRHPATSSIAYCNCREPEPELIFKDKGGKE